MPPCNILSSLSGCLLLPQSRTRTPPWLPETHSPQICIQILSYNRISVEDTWVYKFSRSQVDVATKIPEPKHKLYYFAGGGFRQVATKEHWLLCAEICSTLPEYEVNLVSYPLAPGNLAPAAWTQLERLYEQLVVVSKSSSSSITLMGDSAGGNIALVLGIYGASQYLRSGGASSGRCPLQSILAICPAAGLRNSNPEIDTIDPHDSQSKGHRGSCGRLEMRVAIHGAPAVARPGRFECISRGQNQS